MSSQHSLSSSESSSKLKYGGPKFKTKEQNSRKTPGVLEEIEKNQAVTEIQNDFSLFKDFNQPKSAKNKSIELLVS